MIEKDGDTMQPSRPARAGSSCFSERRLEALTRRLQSDIAARFIPGAALLVRHRGHVVLDAALGFQDQAAGTPMASDTIFRIYSMTKPIVSVAAMMLVEQGRMLLSDPIANWLPELARLKVGVEGIDARGRRTLRLEDAQQPITVQDLLRHTSGFTYGVFGDSLVKQAYRNARIGSPRATSDEFIRNLSQLPLMYQPGSVWEYSHSTDVLGVLLERVSGMPLDALLAERILRPLGMRDTGFWVEPDRHHRIAEAFATDPVTGAAVKLNQPRRRPNFLSGGAGLMSTMQDYLRFAAMLAGEGELDGVRLLSRKTLRYMASDHLVALPRAKCGQSYLPGPGCGFGLGFAVRTHEGGAFMPGSIGDFSWSGLAGTYFWVDPQEDLLAIFMMQAPEQRNAYRQLFRNMVYAALE
ncbi:MAG TPA: serine hydrolase domain-containing protein [Noviherbaspirillum sp.]|uniref:serine hydrolase domain-containing protein n=1 Tax=Noviherbaspirillum sp. TaxID=1926288 RepID=UPI002D522398|nr:serine hydrolase domain-containing protein [Noviherbaspirillum sp.]HYD94461.1 serine hydrolase domain-containing protein [Noviherbaspirillum sp.]